MSTRATARTVRPKKLNSKTTVQIFREEQVDVVVVDLDAARAQIETGVEKAEESEYHLQQAIKASQTAAQDARLKDAYIPTPPTITNEVQYDVLYPRAWKQPATYIRSSATVEDCSGTLYNMDEDDEIALNKINGSLPSGLAPCSETYFEDVMQFFEETASTKQPFAAVDSPPVLPLEELEEQYDDAVPQHVRIYAKLVYAHWSSRRSLSGNRTLTPSLKFETGAETDDTDPYVCFRRRELRQARKTRNRDQQSTEKLRRLRTELESAKTLLLMVKEREQRRKLQLEMDKQLFEQRHLFRETKRKLGMKGDEDLLVNAKKPKPHAGLDPAQAALAQQMGRVPIVGGPTSELRTLQDVRAEKDRAIELEIRTNVEKHVRWNEGFVDNTKLPLTPVVEREFVDASSQYLEAVPASYLPTPPASISEDETSLEQKPDIEMKEAPDSRPSTPFRYASPFDDDGPAVPSFRRRVGRGGRILIDRKIPFRHSRDDLDDRFKFDHSDEEDESVDIITSQQDSNFARMSYRAYLLNRNPAPASDAQRKQMETTQTSRPSPSTQVSPPG